MIYSHTALDRQIAAEEARLTALGVHLNPRRPVGGGRFLKYVNALADLERLSYGYTPRDTRSKLKRQEPALRDILRLTKDRDAPATGSWATVKFGGAMMGLIRMAAIKRIEGKRGESLDWLQAAFSFAQDYQADETRPQAYITRIDRELAWETGAFLRAFSRDRACVALVREILASSWLEPSELVSDTYADFAIEDAVLARGSIYWDSPCTPAGKESEVALRLYQVGTTRKNVRLRMLTCLRRQVESLQDAKGTYTRWADDEDEIWAEFSNGPITDSGAFAAKHLFPFTSGAHGFSRYYCGILARSRLLKAALALVEAGVRGETATTLLLDKQFTDPFSGAPFVYRPAKGGFRLYSVGPNGIDDGGYGKKGDDQELGMCRSTRDL